MKAKKGQTLGALPGIVILLVIVAIVLSIGSEVVDNIRQDQCSTGYNLTDMSCNGGSDLTYAYNASHGGLQGLQEVSEWQDTIGLVVAAAVIIGLVLGAFAVGRRGSL